MFLHSGTITSDGPTPVIKVEPMVPTTIPFWRTCILAPFHPPLTEAPILKVKLHWSTASQTVVLKAKGPAHAVKTPDPGEHSALTQYWYCVAAVKPPAGYGFVAGAPAPVGMPSPKG